MNLFVIDSAVTTHHLQCTGPTLEEDMKTIHKVNTALAVALSAFAFAAFSGTTALAAPITPPGHACLEYNEGGTDQLCAV